MSNYKPSQPRRLLTTIGLILVVGLLFGCGIGSSNHSKAPILPTIGHPIELTATPPASDRNKELTREEITTLQSLTLIDDHPLYTMYYSGAYHSPEISGYKQSISINPDIYSGNSWACSLFAVLGDSQSMFYGRNFDWQHSPAILLFTDPPDGYASVSMVDIEYLGYSGESAKLITDLPLAERRPLLDTPMIPFDGMNEHGLAIGMAAVPPGNMRPDPEKGTIGSLGVIRLILDRAKNLEEALQIFQSYNIRFSEVPIHYLLATPDGQAVLVEFYQGQMVVTPNESSWHQATNFLQAAHSDNPLGNCWRYDAIYQRLYQSGGALDQQAAIALLSQVSQTNTQWSIVYGMNDGQIHLVMDRQYNNSHNFSLNIVR